jgi:hypothetical protein
MQQGWGTEIMHEQFRQRNVLVNFLKEDEKAVGLKLIEILDIGRIWEMKKKQFCL